MAKDSRLYVRRAVVGHLKDDAGYNELAGNRFYGPNPPPMPTWPFGRYGTATVVPLRATCLDGARISFTLHAFAKGEDESAVDELAAAIVASLDGVSLPLEAPYPARLSNVRWTATTTIRDSDEATGWHAIISMEATVTS